jgi:hypothetical protein
MARHQHRPHLSQGTPAITVVVVALKPLPANPPQCHTFCAFYQLVVYLSTTSEENEVSWTTSLPLSSPLENWAEGITDVAYLMS